LLFAYASPAAAGHAEMCGKIQNRAEDMLEEGLTPYAENIAIRARLSIVMIFALSRNMIPKLLSTSGNSFPSKMNMATISYA
jgi:hypothetical protein